ncbi:MAG: hypothetical protein ACUVTD_05425 [Nitrososphaerales archaeon]
MSKDETSSSTEDLERRLKELEVKLSESVPKKEAEELKKKISELESYLKKYEEELKATKRIIKDLQSPFRDNVSRLQEVVGEAAKVSLQYGGYEILITDPHHFPWNLTLNTLLDASFEVWVTRKDGQNVIRCKPPSF